MMPIPVTVLKEFDAILKEMVAGSIFSYFSPYTSSNYQPLCSSYPWVV